jgi:hypothetical protein
MTIDEILNEDRFEDRGTSIRAGGGGGGGREGRRGGGGGVTATGTRSRRAPGGAPRAHASRRCLSHQVSRR